MGRVGATGLLLVTVLLAPPCAARVADPAALSGPHAYSDAQIRVISIVPGAVIHGLGHLAAGDASTARWLFLAETAGYAAMFTAGNNGRPGLDRSKPRAIAFGAGLALFLGSWVYDIVDAPSSRPEHDRVSLGVRVDDRAPDRHTLRIDLTARLDI